MQHLFEILKLTEASLEGDRQKGVAYATQLADKLEAGGEAKGAARLRKLLKGTATANALNMLAGMTKVPVDGESRMSLADEHWVDPCDVTVIMPETTVASLREFVTYVRAADRLLAEGVGVSPSLLLYGPPGCGKTEIARSIAADLQLPLMTARTDTLMSSYLGSTAKNLRMLFDHCASRPCVLFLDEFDAIAKLRDDQHEMGELKRVVVSLLQNIDAVKGQTVLVAATNHEHLLDPAVWRRFSYRIRVALPDDVARQSLFELFLSRTFKGRALSRLVAASAGLSGSDIREVCDGARREVILSEREQVEPSDILRRILLRRIDTTGMSIPDIIAEAKELDPHTYSHRALAEAFQMSPANITRILRLRGAE